MAFTGRRFIDECFQARGKQVDQRADIWAFRVVLYEMLTGQRLFQGDDATETLALVIKDEPKWERVPAKVQRLVRSCLKKDPKRLQAIGDWGGRTIRRCTPCFLSRNLLIRLVRRQLFLRIDDNYFSRSTTITPCPAGGAKRRCQTSLEMSPLAPSRRPRGFIHKIGFFLAAAGGRGGGKVGILVLDFHFSTAHNSRFFACLLFCLRHVTPAISTALPPSGFSWWRRPPPHSPSAWLSAC